MESNKAVGKKHWQISFWADVILLALGILGLLLIFSIQYATGEFGYSAEIKKNFDIKPTESVFVLFSQPVAETAVKNNFEIFPEAQVSLIWSDQYRKMEIRPVGRFKSGQNYSIIISPTTSFSLSRILGKNEEPLTLNFQTESLPQVVSISPASGDPNVRIDSAVTVIFDKSTVGYDVNFVIDPFSSFDLSYGEERKTFTILPKGKLDYERDYAFGVRLASSEENLAAKEMPEIFRANFRTEASPPPPPTVEEVVLPEDKLAGIVSDSQVATVVAQITEGKYIDINLAKQQLSIFENGERLGTYKVSTGKKGMATPTGKFSVMSKYGRAWSKKYNLYMPFWMQFTSAGHGIHELPEWKNGYKEGANHLGIPVSHGCVRLGVGPAAKVYGWADVGTPIVIHY